MPMTKEELMIPRYKVIADYPAMGEAPIIGFIFKDCTPSMCSHMDKYPHLFQKLEWWEERNIQDLPKYVRLTNAIAIVELKDYLGYGTEFSQAYLTGSTPATESEYLSYMKSKNNPSKIQN